MSTTLKVFITIVLLSVLFPPLGFAETVDAKILRLAEQGDAKAQYVLGWMCEAGQGVTQDYAEAVKWYRLAAKQGIVGAQGALGVMYDKGRGVKQNYNEAVKWYRIAAEHGRADAQYNLGEMYYYGRGVNQNYAEAAKWYRRAADQGNAMAQCDLGVLYNNGQGVTQDYAEAVKWCKLAAEQGNAPAQYNLGVMYNYGRGVNQNYAEAAKWYRLAAEQGNAMAQCDLGVLFNNGQGVTQDYAEAVKWYKLAAEQGNAAAQYNLGYMYGRGQGVSQDYAEAAKWYRRAAEQGDADAQYDLGEMYYTGQGVSQNFAEAVKLLEGAASQGHAKAKEVLAMVRNRNNALRQVPSEKLAYIVLNEPLSYSSLETCGSPGTAQYPDDIRVAAIDRMYNEGMLSELQSIACKLFKSDDEVVKQAIKTKLVTPERLEMLCKRQEWMAFAVLVGTPDESICAWIVRHPDLMEHMFGSHHAATRYGYGSYKMIANISSADLLLAIIADRNCLWEARYNAAIKLFNYDNVTSAQIRAAISSLNDVSDGNLTEVAEEGLKAARRIGATDIVKALEGE